MSNSVQEAARDYRHAIPNLDGPTDYLVDQAFLAGAAWRGEQIVRLMREKMVEFASCNDFERQRIAEQWRVRANWLEELLLAEKDPQLTECNSEKGKSE